MFFSFKISIYKTVHIFANYMSGLIEVSEVVAPIVRASLRTCVLLNVLSLSPAQVINF